MYSTTTKWLDVTRLLSLIVLLMMGQKMAGQGTDSRDAEEQPVVQSESEFQRPEWESLAYWLIGTKSNIGYM